MSVCDDIRLRLQPHLDVLGYDAESQANIFTCCDELLRHRPTDLKRSELTSILDGGGAILIVYPDHVLSNKKPTLRVLDELLYQYLGESPLLVHLLPCWESTGDGGFAICDPKTIKSEFGSIQDLKSFIRQRPVCLDLVLNHVSTNHPFLARHLSTPPHERGLLAEAPALDRLAIPLSHRGHPAITSFTSAYGERWLWTTFGAGQVDLNYRSPTVLEWLLDVLAFYLGLGAQAIRLDAIGHAWKSGAVAQQHAPQCHALVSVIRAFADFFRPGALVIAQADYASWPGQDYIGNGRDKAHLLYRHETSPLIAHALITGDAGYFRAWLEDVAGDPSGRWINFTSTHDSVFLRPWSYPLPPAEVSKLIDACVAGGGSVEYSDYGYGPVPASLCSTYFSLLKYRTDVACATRRLVLAHALLLALPGVPALYLTSLIGMGNWAEWEQMEELPRSINRERYSIEQIRRALSTTRSRQSRVLRAIKQLIGIRTTRPAFRPDAPTTVHRAFPQQVIACSRGDEDEVLCLFNIGHSEILLEIRPWTERLVGEEPVGGLIRLPPMSFAWLARP